MTQLPNSETHRYVLGAAGAATAALWLLAGAALCRARRDRDRARYWAGYSDAAQDFGASAAPPAPRLRMVRGSRS